MPAEFGTQTIFDRTSPGPGAMPFEKEKQLHHAIGFVGLRAQATAVGLLKLCMELRDAGVLEEAAVGRIKDAIATEITFCAPRTTHRPAYKADVLARLDRLFSGQESVGCAENLSFGAPPAR